MRFFKSVIDLFESHFEGSVLDIGSNDLGGGPHLLLKSREYIGVDLGPGKNVDLISGGQDVELPSNYFDVVMSSECFEHNPYWRSTFHNMVRMAKPGGLVVFSCAGIGRQEHGTSRSYAELSPLAIQIGQEYYGNVSKRQVKAIMDEFAFSIFDLFENHVTCDLYFAGIKKPGKSSDLHKFRSLQNQNRQYLRRHGSWLMVLVRYALRPFWKMVNRYPLIKWLVNNLFGKNV